MQRWKGIKNSITSKIIFFVSFEIGLTDLVEGYLQDLYKNKQIKGEWFRLSDEDILYIIKYLLWLSKSDIYQWAISNGETVISIKDQANGIPANSKI